MTREIDPGFTLYTSDSLTFKVYAQDGSYGHMHIVVEADGGVLVRGQDLEVRVMEQAPSP